MKIKLSLILLALAASVALAQVIQNPVWTPTYAPSSKLIGDTNGNLTVNGLRILTTADTLSSSGFSWGQFTNSVATNIFTINLAGGYNMPWSGLTGIPANLLNWSLISTNFLGPSNSIANMTGFGTNTTLRSPSLIIVTTNVLQMPISGSFVLGGGGNTNFGGTWTLTGNPFVFPGGGVAATNSAHTNLVAIWLLANWIVNIGIETNGGAVQYLTYGYGLTNWGTTTSGIAPPPTNISSSIVFSNTVNYAVQPIQQPGFTEVVNANQFNVYFTNSLHADSTTNLLTIFTPPAPGNYTVKGFINIYGSDDYANSVYRMLSFTDIRGIVQTINITPAGVQAGYTPLNDVTVYLSMNPVTIYDTIQWLSIYSSWQIYDSGAEVTCP
jgi:hypothetical protein